MLLLANRGPEVIKLEYSLKIKPNDWLLVVSARSQSLGFILSLKIRVRKQPIIGLYFEFENELKFYNLEPGFTNI